MANNLYGRICLDAIPDELVFVGNDGKRYVNIDVKERREPSQYGETHYIKAYRMNASVRPFIGDLKPCLFNKDK